MRLLSLSLLLLAGCPKKEIRSIDEEEKKEKLRELLEDEEIFEDLPEAGEEDERQNSEEIN